MDNTLDYLFSKLNKIEKKHTLLTTKYNVCMLVMTTIVFYELVNNQKIKTDVVK